VLVEKRGNSSMGEAGVSSPSRRRRAAFYLNCLLLEFLKRSFCGVAATLKDIFKER
jgi:hypothetical protein